MSEPPPPAEFSLANELLQTIYAGVGEGYMPYSEADKSAIEELVVELESSGQDTDVQFPRDLGKLDGRWRLVFTNNLAGLGKLSPIALRDVYQVVDTSAGMVNNVVYATMSPPLFSETWGKLGERVADLAKTVEDRVSFPVDFNIQHNFEVSSQSRPAQVIFLGVCEALACAGGCLLLVAQRMHTSQLRCVRTRGGGFRSR